MRILRLSLPLFWQILATIWLAVVLALLVSHVGTREMVDRERSVIERRAGLQNIAVEAVRLRETEGREASRQYLSEQGQMVNLRLRLIEPESRDGGSLQDSGNTLVEDTWGELGGTSLRYRPLIIDTAAEYQLAARPPAGSGGWIDPWSVSLMELLSGLVIITLACWLISRRISEPLRQISQAAEAISRGNTSARVAAAITSRGDEIGALASSFNDMTESLTDLLERRRRLLRDVCHDLRTSLTRQRLALDAPGDEPGSAAALNRILRQNQRMEAMTDQVLTLARLAEQGADIGREPVNPATLVHQVLQEAAGYAEQRGVDCRLKVSPECRNITVLGDAGLLHRALDNVLQNALDHTPPGRSVVLALREAERKLICTVTDAGPGVSDKALVALFEPYYRTDPSRSGQGLGLTIARDIVRAHDGEISAMRHETGGLAISLSLPVFTGAPR
ncbi:ATP-binding protein [Marinobacter sp.]|uniref:sensor histidine kinase n=1 Tax=Marinobacter sp. TaxID=50741 RepID=UPI003850012C